METFTAFTPLKKRCMIELTKCCSTWSKGQKVMVESMYPLTFS